MATIIHTDSAPAAAGPYSQAVDTGSLVFVSGQLGFDASGDLRTGDIRAETRQVLNNMKAILASAGLTMDNVVKCEVFLDDMNDFAAMNEVYAEFFSGDSKPARQAVEVARLPKDAGVEISCIAAR